MLCPLVLQVFLPIAIAKKAASFAQLNVPNEHLIYWINRDQNLLNQCLSDDKCRRMHANRRGACWGYEFGCNSTMSYSTETARCYSQSFSERIELFKKQGDFEKLADILRTMRAICASKNNSGSTLVCSRNMRYCNATNIFFDFSNLRASTSQRAYELQYFQSDERFKVNNQNCDLIFDNPTIIIKLDADISMYHHFCDFINLYASQHVNGSVNTEIDILLWDTWQNGYHDPFFGVTWSAFSSRRKYQLISLDRKKVCFKNAFFSLLARQRFGLYYNMPLVDNCVGSGLFHAFSQHILHRLKIKQNGPLNNQIRITFLSRGTRYRRVLNQNELLEVLQKLPDVVVRVVDYNRHFPFSEQLDVTHNTDVFIGMHGSGLTHLLFLPDWASIFELYNCGDADCYKDLARLRGVNYFTWRDQAKLSAFGDNSSEQSEKGLPKFMNYQFDSEEFRQVMLQAISAVHRHPQYLKKLQKYKYGTPVKHTEL